jgi:hypothetical protein
MSSYTIKTLVRSNDRTPADAAFTGSALVVGSITREFDVYKFATTITWSTENDWRDVLTPLTGETGEIWFDYTDSADSNKKRFQIFQYEKTDATTIAFTTSTTAGIVDIGAATTKIKVQNASGKIQCLHDAGVNRSCTVKIRSVRDAS